MARQPNPALATGTTETAQRSRAHLPNSASARAFASSSRPALARAHQRWQHGAAQRQQGRTSETQRQQGYGD
eukprot:9503270-Pyramimonas_sp.AAC.1